MATNWFNSLDTNSKEKLENSFFTYFHFFFEFFRYLSQYLHLIYHFILHLLVQMEVPTWCQTFYLRYGNIGCGVFKACGIQNNKKLAKIIEKVHNGIWNVTL